VSKRKIEVGATLTLKPAAVTAIIRDYFARQGLTVSEVFYLTMPGVGDLTAGSVSVGLNNSGPFHFAHAAVRFDPAGITTMPVVEVPDPPEATPQPQPPTETT
jgi:hypothetical protein